MFSCQSSCHLMPQAIVSNFVILRDAKNAHTFKAARTSGSLHYTAPTVPMDIMYSFAGGGVAALSSVFPTSRCVCQSVDNLHPCSCSDESSGRDKHAKCDMYACVCAFTAAGCVGYIVSMAPLPHPFIQGPCSVIFPFIFYTDHMLLSLHPITCCL